MVGLSKATFVLALLATLIALVTQVAAQEPPHALTITRIKGNVYWARGGAGLKDASSNDGIIVGTTGVILVDTKTTVEAERGVIAETAKITPKMVTTVLITHSDGDHVNGLAALPDGLTIIAQENCKKEMEESASDRDPAPQDRLPTKTYGKTDSLTIDGVRIRLYHWAPAHTSGDTIVYLPDERIVFGGDVLTTDRPDISVKVAKNGSAAGWIETARGLLALDADVYLTGHGEMMTKADVQKRLDLIQNKYDKVKAMVAQGKSIGDIKAFFGEPTAPLPPNPNGAAARATVTEIIYKEVAEKN